MKFKGAADSLLKDHWKCSNIFEQENLTKVGKILMVRLLRNFDFLFPMSREHRNIKNMHKNHSFNTPRSFW